MTMKTAPWAAGLLALASAGAQAGITSLDLGQYQLTATHLLPSLASEASAVTWNWDSDSLFVLGDEGDAIVEVNKQGQQLSSMSLSGFDDTEGLTYIGNGQFVMTEERLQDAYSFSYSAGGAMARSSLAAVSLGDTIGNTGIEGLSYDPLTGRYVVVKEKSPQAVYDAAIDFGAGSATVNDLFLPNLGLLDLSDVQVLGTVASLFGTADQDNLLVFSQESALLLEVSRSGDVLSQFDFSAIAGDVEGVTIGADGTIYLVGETPALYVLQAPVPEPGTYALMLFGLGLVGFTARRARR